MALPKQNKLVYPTGLVTPDTDYLHIQVLKYQPPSTLTQTGNFQFRTSDQANRVFNGKNTRIEGDIFLPMPSNLSDINSVSWKDSTLNPIAADAIEQAGGLISDLSYENLKTDAGAALGQAGSRLGDIVNKYRGALEDAGLRDGLETFLVGKAVNVAGANVDLNDLISRRSGQVLNPNLELLFKGVNLRRFTYEFLFTPRTREESNTVKGIIRTFKRRMSSKSSANTGSSKGLFISSPDVFQLTFKTGLADHPFLYKHKVCALTNLDIDYTGTGTYATYEDATPVQISMRVNFSELSPIYAEDYDSDVPNPGEGVGF